MTPKKGKSKTSGSVVNFSIDASQDDDLRRIQGKYSPVFILLITVLGIAVAETIAMMVVYFERHLPYYQQVILDATVMTVIIFPLLYFLSFRPIIQHIQQRYQVERVQKSRLRIIQHANTHTLDETLRFTLDELESLTGSEAGYFHFIDADQRAIRLQTWSTNTLQHMCRVGDFERHYPVDQAGVWADCIRQRSVVVHNDYASLPNRKGIPEGHALIVREMAVPIMRDKKIVAVLGVGNKPDDYTTKDIDIVFTLADFTWDIIKQKQAADAQRESEEKFRTLVDWTYDWELWIDPKGRIVYSSPSCIRITGHSPEEFTTDPNLLLRIVHPADRKAYEKHHQVVHDENGGIMRFEYRIVIADGLERWIEHVCRPLFGSNQRYLGRRISNRDITERKQVEEEIQEQNRKEKQLIHLLHTMQLDIARDLHDTIGQNIGYLRMRLDYLVEKDLPARRDELIQMSRVATESYDLVRGTLAILQSKGTDDLIHLFKRYASQVVERSGFMVEFRDQGEAGILSPNQMRQIFYIFREALSNIEKHSGASQVWVDVHWDDEALTLSIADNGKGFDPKTVQDGHYGLKFMRERTAMMDGSFELKTQPGTGAQIVISVPMHKDQTAM